MYSSELWQTDSHVTTSLTTIRTKDSCLTPHHPSGPVVLILLHSAPGQECPVLCVYSFASFRVSYKWIQTAGSFLYMIFSPETHPCCLLLVLLSYFPLYEHTRFIHSQLKNIWVISSFWWLWIKLVTFAYKFLNELKFSFLLGIHPRMELLGCVISICSTLYEIISCLPYCSYHFCIPTNNVWEV